MIVSTGEQEFPADHVFTRSPAFPYWTLELTMGGSLLRRSGTMKRFRPQPNRTLILSPPGMLYSLRGEVPGWEIWVIFDPREALLPYLEWEPGEQGMPVAVLPEGRAGRELVELFKEVHEAFSRRSGPQVFLAENALERMIVKASLAEGAARSLADERIVKVLKLIESAPAATVSVPELAREANLSESRFAHLFRGETGETPMAYLERLRMEQARQLLLRSDLQVQEVAREVGFEDATYFSTRFRRLYGKSPRTWRQSPG